MLVLEIMNNYPANFSEQDLATTRSFLLKSNTRAFETNRAKLEMLNKLSRYQWQPDYIRQREAYVRGLQISDVRTNATKHLDPDKMIYLIVGDAATQFDGLDKLGLGKPVLMEQK